MLVSVSLVILLGALIAFLVHAGQARLVDVLVSAAFGFLLAGTGLAPAVRAALAALGSALGSVHP